MKISKTQTFTVLGRDNYIQSAGIDVYKGIIVLFDEDFDQRIFVFLKKYYERIKPCVKAVYETHGQVTLYLHKPATDTVVELAEDGADVDIDSWSVELNSIWEEVCWMKP